MELRQQSFRIHVSIQLLLLFYYATFKDYEWDNGFQYNFCYCSIFFSRNNTRRSKFQYNFCYCSILLAQGYHSTVERFNTTFVTVLLTYLYRLHYSVLPFQYNFCYCSMPLIPLFIKGHLRFNTAFVIVLSAPEFAQNELLTLFQYSFCYCSIYLLIGVKILVKVSIQLLLLFYITNLQKQN